LQTSVLPIIASRFLTWLPWHFGERRREGASPLDTVTPISPRGPLARD